MTIYNIAIGVCIFALIIVPIAMTLTFTWNKTHSLWQDATDRKGDRGPTLVLGNPRPKSRYSKDEWDEEVLGKPQVIRRIWRRKDRGKDA